MLGTVGAVLIISMDDGLGVAVCIKGVAEPFQLVAEFEIVIDLTVEDNPGGAVLVVNRLLAAFHIDNRQPPHAQADSLAEVEAVIIRATMADSVTHARDQRMINSRVSVLDYSYNPTHK